MGRLVMTKGKHTEAEVIGALKQVEAGRTAADVAREMGVSKHTIYTWKAKFGGLDVNEAQRLRQLEDENHRLKKLVADLSLDKDMLTAVIGQRAAQGRRKFTNVFAQCRHDHRRIFARHLDQHEKA